MLRGGAAEGDVISTLWLAAVGELMSQTAGEVCDGIICHGFTTEKYLREVTIPNVAKGRERAGKSMDDFMISGPFFVVSGQNDEEIDKAAAATRQQIAFYGSTPAYAKVFELHGWEGLHPKLNTLSKKGAGSRWVALSMTRSSTPSQSLVSQTRSPLN